MQLNIRLLRFVISILMLKIYPSLPVTINATLIQFSYPKTPLFFKTSINLIKEKRLTLTLKKKR